jgi:hypothetical protein
MARGSPRIQYGRVYNVVPQDITLERWLEICKNAFATKQTVGFSWDDAGIGDLDSRKIVGWDVKENRAAFEAFIAQYYPGATVSWAGAGATTPPVVTPPPPVPTGETMVGKHPALPLLPFNSMMGVHVLNMGNPEIQKWVKAGCRSWTVMDNVSSAREVKAESKGAVIYRKYVGSNIPEPWFYVADMGLSTSDAFMVMGLNEADSIDVNDIERRFEWDRKFAEEVWKQLPGCFPVIGSFSMGTPKLEDPSVAKRFRETYGAFLNANWQRVGLNYHGYSARPTAEFPPSNASVIAPEWLELRHLNWAYDPNLGGVSKRVVLVNDESGVDIGGFGGFPGSGYDNNEKFLKWFRYRRDLYKKYSQQYVFNLFQGHHNSDRWRGYDVGGYISPMTEIWAGRV